ncbi:MAG: flagellar biosynthesis protein FlhA [Nitrospirae bacterium RIFCSPLOW2_12_42_9]|nr:MAG: flagellar biosynthesis protein FlhA [Nitrospirae bacterium RIFCSPLOW2_12_42_9]
MAATIVESNRGVFISLAKNSDVVLGLLVLGIVAVMIIPVPSIIMDVLLTFSLTLSIVIILISMYILKPLEFSVFPSVLLIATLARLAINVASTRLILIKGHEGPDAAGKVIMAFGNFVIGGNYAVGLVIFSILVVINFVVITKGAGRIAEVAARFTLDAMPGKQMSIDADLNAGLIDEAEARRRRAQISQEAEFYGAMDGASKFVRGDAVAGIIITLINIVGGLIIGVLQHGMDIKTALHNFTLLTVGDGLVGQIPALIVSTSAGIIVTRAASESNLGTEVSKQIFAHPKAIGVSAAVIFFFGLIPGLPHIPFLIFAIITGLIAWVSYNLKNTMGEELGWTAGAIPDRERKASDEEKGTPQREEPDYVPPLDILELNLGYSLIPLVDSEQKGDLVERIKSVRHQFASEMGIMIPSVHIRDSLQLEPNRYSILIKGTEVANGELMMDRHLALNPTGIEKGIQGIATREPSFGLPALWILTQDKERAELSGYTVVDPSTVIATHLTEIIRTYSYELIGRQEIQSMLNNFAKRYPKVVEELVPGLIPLGIVVKVLQNLLKERVPVRDLLTILEALADYAPSTKDPEILTEYVRANLARTITKQYQAQNNLPVITLEPSLEEKISSAVRQVPQGMHISLEPRMAHGIINRLRSVMENANKKGIYPVLLTSPAIRSPLRRFIERFIPNIVILSSNEISSMVNVQPIDIVRYSDADQKV